MLAGLRACAGNVSATARHLGVDRANLGRKLPALGLTGELKRLRAAHGRSRLPEVAPREPPLRAEVEELERALVAEALERQGGNMLWAAAWLGLDRSVMHRKVGAFGLGHLQRRSPVRPPGPPPPPAERLAVALARCGPTKRDVILAAIGAGERSSARLAALAGATRNYAARLLAEART